ncbi:hypothetical protein ACFYXS_14890 [Streptomyces sp. NPDC002574]|uniref:hypothetical protein n=1 Tax=Streptomyces sp. NPDC002574 TaxID=3364652 RepID=UPI0036C10E82
MSDAHEAVLAALSWNPSAPGSVLLRLLACDRRRVRRNVAERRDLPEAVVDAILADPDPSLRMEFAGSARADPAQRARLLDDPSWKVVMSLAMGPVLYRGRAEPLPDWVYERLLAHPEPRVRHETVTSSPVPAHLLARLADHTDGRLRQAACRAWDILPGATQDALLDDPDPQVRHAAALRVCHRDAERTTWPAEELADPWAGEALGFGLLSRELAERMVAERPASVAPNPSLPPDLVRQLATHPDPYVRLLVSARRELTERERAAIDYTVDPEARLGTLGWVWAARDNPDVLRQCATSAHTWLRRSAAVCPELAPELVELLAQDDDFAVRLLLCEFHPEAPPELLLDLYLEQTHRAVEMLVNNPLFPAAGLAARFATAEDHRQRRLALRDPGLTAESLEAFTRDPECRWEAARDPRLPLPRLRELLADPDMTSSAAGNPGLPAEDMHRLLDAAGVPAR